jgi:DNA-directed RNA polymerase sigma subunit (sigma70/sigma32)
MRRCAVSKRHADGSVPDARKLLDAYLNGPEVTYRDREVTKLFYGLGDGYSYSLEEVARIFKTTPEEIQRINGEMRLKLINQELLWVAEKAKKSK